MIARHWKGIAKLNEVENYTDHLMQETFPGLARIDGFIRASILKRSVAGGVEFLIVTEWRSIDSIARFAGEHAETAVVPAVVRRMMLQYDECARHYEVSARFDGQ